MSSIVIPFIGGLAMFIYGMNIMADGLQHAAGSKMKKILEVLTQNKLMGIALGALVTAIIQSSSATTVMVVGFVNAGLMNLTQAISVIMGANIGTTITGWLVSAGEWAKMFSPSTLAPIAVMVGVIITLVGKRQQSKDVAGIIGFGILFIGMNTMSDAVYPLRESEVFKTAFISMGSNPFLGILVGAGVTAIIQSSSASQGILLSLASAGLVPTNAAVFIIMGQNIGTCVTAILSSVGASKNAKCVGTMHLTFNIAGTIIFSILAMFLFARLDPSYGEGIINMTQISFIHTVFNVGTTIILMPFSGYIIKFAMKVNGLKAVETKSDEAELVHLDKRMMSTPSVAVEGAKLETIRMGRIARENLSLALSTLSDHDEEKMADVKQREFVIDKLCDNISKYLIDLCMLHLSDKDNEMVTSLLNTVSDMERVGDHAENIVELAEEMKQEGISFSDTALEELNEMSTTTLGAYDNAVKALELDDITYAVKTSFLEDQVDAMEKKLRAGHIERLSNAECSVNAGIHFIDLLGNLERVSDHAMNIAQVVLNEHRAEKNFHEEKNVE